MVSLQQLKSAFVHGAEGVDKGKQYIEHNLDQNVKPHAQTYRLMWPSGMKAIVFSEHAILKSDTQRASFAD